MTPRSIQQERQAGFTMIEVLVSLVIILLGLLGLAGLQTRLYQAEFESYQRSQALILLYDMVERINLHRDTAAFKPDECFAISASSGTPTYGTGTDDATLTCTATATTADVPARDSMREWNRLLKGASETSAAGPVGAVVGARGCVMYDPATELVVSGGGVGTGIFTVAVSWQGTTPTVVPAVNCGNTQYGADDALRRTVSTTFRFGKLK